MKLIVKSILVFLLLFAGYHVGLKRLPQWAKVSGNAGSQTERNLMRAEAYFQAHSDPPVVIVGSSISDRLHDLPSGWYPLAFPGGSPFTGLEIILRSGKHPRYVLIETNVLDMPPDRQMLDLLENPLLRRARNKLPELMEQNKPTHVLVRVLNRNGTQPATEAITPEFYRGLVQRRLRELAKPVPPAELHAMTARLEHDVKALEARGTRVVFFEVPEIPQSRLQPLKVSMRDEIRAAFPEPKNRWVPFVDPATYRSSDAVHLTRDSATRYCGVLVRYLRALDPSVAPDPVVKPMTGLAGKVKPAAAPARTAAE